MHRYKFSGRILRKPRPHRLCGCSVGQCDLEFDRGIWFRPWAPDENLAVQRPHHHLPKRNPPLSETDRRVQSNDIRICFNGRMNQLPRISHADMIGLSRYFGNRWIPVAPSLPSCFRWHKDRLSRSGQAFCCTIDIAPYIPHRVLSAVSCQRAIAFSTIRPPEAISPSTHSRESTIPFAESGKRDRPASCQQVFTVRKTAARRVHAGK